jgi:hypothetical protein
LWSVSIGFVIINFWVSISAASFFGGSIGDGLRMAFEYQPWLTGSSLASLAGVAIYHCWSRCA